MVGVTNKVIFMTMMASDGFQLFDSTSPHTLLRQYKSTQLFNRVWKIYSCCFHSTFHGWVSSKVFLVPNLCAHEELGEHASETTVHRDICRVRERSGFFGGGGSRLLVGGVRLLSLRRWRCTSSFQSVVAGLLPGAHSRECIANIDLHRGLIDDIEQRTIYVDRCEWSGRCLWHESLRWVHP